MAVERSGTRKSKRVAAMETKKPRKSPKTISLSALPKKPGQSKQPKAARKPGSDPKHPTYFQMVVEAIVMLKERAGSSRQAIAKIISERYRGNLPDNFRRLMNNQLRALTAKGKLVQVRGSFKLPEDVKNSKEVKELKKSVSVSAHVTVGAPKKAEKKKAEVPKTKRAKAAAKPAVAAKKKTTLEATPKKKVTVKTEISSSISGRGKQKPEVAGSSLTTTATRKSGRVAKPVAAGPTTPGKRSGRK